MAATDVSPTELDDPLETSLQSTRGPANEEELQAFVSKELKLSFNILDLT